MPTNNEISDFARRNRLALPVEYVEFLSKLEFPAWYADGTGKRVCFVPLATSPGKRPLGLEVTVRLGEKPYPFFQLLTSHLEMWKEFTGQDFFDNEAGEPFDAKAIASSVCIAEDDGCDLIFLAADGSVWAHHHDGCQVEPLAATFAEYLSTCVARNRA